MASASKDADLDSAGSDEERPSFDTNMDVLPSKRTKVAKEVEVEEKPMSKRKRRKLEQLAKKREMVAMRSSVLAELKVNQLTETQAALMRASQSTHKTRKHQVAEARRRLASGVPLAPEMMRLRKRKAADDGEDVAEGDDSAEESAGEDEGAHTSSKPLTHHQVRLKSNPAPSQEAEYRTAAAVSGASPVSASAPALPKLAAKREQKGKPSTPQIAARQDAKDSAKQHQAKQELAKDEGPAKEEPAKGETPQEELAKEEPAKEVLSKKQMKKQERAKKAQDAKTGKESLQSAAAKPVVERAMQPLQPVRVQRRDEIEKQREKLPAVMVEQEVVEAVLGDDVTLVCGDTGCGKSTQVPQFLYEAGVTDGGRYLIGVTQPRRVAAISVSQRVGDELDDPSAVGYQVRYDRSHITKDTKIKFMTDGILLREVQSDFLLRQYTTIIIDEAHERSVNCDILIGLLSRATQRRRRDYDEAVAAGRFVREIPTDGSPHVPPPLRLVIMSATLRTTDFTENTVLFPVPPPVVSIDARTFPVTAHFARHTEEDYIRAARKTVMKIHKDLPPGSVLVFVTGREEVHRLCRLLRQSSALGRGAAADEQEVEDWADHEDEDDGPNLLEASDEEDAAFDDSLDSNEVACEIKGAVAAPDRGKKQKRPASALETGNADHAAASSAGQAEQPHASGVAGAPSRGPRKKKKKKTTSAVAEETEPATELDRGAADGSGATADGKGEREINFRLDLEEDVVELNPEAAEKAGEDAKDQEARTQKKIRMGKLDKSRTADGAFSGAGFGEGPLRVLPLYAQLPARDQLAAFSKAQEGQRIVVVSTNVAETSVTLPNIRYVVDTGCEKRRQYRAATGVSRFAVERISKASSNQRAGRAGRLGPGHAYRLYSAAVYENHFKAFAPIAVLETPMDPVLLLLASMGVPRVDSFPWPTPPSHEGVVAAAHRLRALGAIKDDNVTGKKGVRCTQLGYRLAAVPVAPRYAKMLLLAVAATEELDEHIIPHACALVAALSIGNLTSWGWMKDEEEDEAGAAAENEHSRAERQVRKLALEQQKKEAPRWTKLRDDAEGLLWIMGGYAWAASSSDEEAERFCQQNKVNPRQVSEAHSLMQQLGELLSKRLSLSSIGVDLELPLRPKPLTSSQALKLRGCLVEGLIDRIAVMKPELGRYAYVCADLGPDSPVFFHNSSNAFRHRPQPLVIAFNEIISTSKSFMRDCIAVDPMVLSRRAVDGTSHLLKIGDFLPVPAPRYLAEQDSVLAFAQPSYAPLAHSLPTVELEVPADNIFRYKVFAKALLDGEVLEGVPPRDARLLARPAVVLQAASNPRVLGVVGPLWEARIGSRDELAKRWATDHRFLLEGYLRWLQPSMHEATRLSWPPKCVAPRR